MDVSENHSQGQDITFGFYDTLPFDYEKVHGDEIERYMTGQKKASGNISLGDAWLTVEMPGMDSLDPALSNCLMDIEQKLNLIIRHLSMQEKGQRIIPSAKEIYISQQEIRFSPDKELATGEILRIKMILPLYPLAFITVLCEVTGMRRLESGRKEVTARYLNFNEDERDKIITYLFKKQRESIRNEKGK